MSEAMNYKLPPLPKPDTHCFDEDTGKDVWSHSPEQMQAYAITAIQVQASVVQQEPVAWKHDCAALLTNEVELWIDSCPHCGKPRTAQHPAQQAKPLSKYAIDRIVGTLQVNWPDWFDIEQATKFARAIESAACAERDKRIAELEQQLEEARKDAERYRWLAWHSDTLPIVILDTRTNRTMFGYVANDAIDAAMKVQK